MVRLIFGIDIPRSVRIGPGIMIHHFGGVVVNPLVVMGAHCTLRHMVTLGNLTEGGPVPVLGDRVELGVGCSVLGDVRVGEGARIGAHALVLRDVPAGATVGGVPASQLTAPGDA